MGRKQRVLLLLVGVMSLAACGGRMSRPAGPPGAPVARAAVERFLQLAGERDYVQMGWVFGTADGPILRRYPAPEVEQRMYALASVLGHDSYAIGGESPVPGRTGAAVGFAVELQRGARVYTVPFTAVRGPDGRWYVEQVDLQAITNVR